MTRLGADGSWGPHAAREFRYEHGLSLFDSAARACGVFEGRWVAKTGEHAVGVVICDRRWLLYPVDSGWMAARRGPVGQPDLTHSVWLERAPGELWIPTTAWGQLLAADEPVLHDGDAPAPYARSGVAPVALFTR